MTDNYNCPLCDSKYKRYHELSASNWECGSVKVDVSGTIFPTDLCNARQRIKELEKGLANTESYVKEYVKKNVECRDELLEAIKELEKGLANTASYAKEYVKKYVECRDKLLEATKDLKNFGHDECAEEYEIFLLKI